MKSSAQSHKKLRRKEYEAERYKLHAELVRLQEWVVAKGLYEKQIRRSGATRGSAIRAGEILNSSSGRVPHSPLPTSQHRRQ
jgi:polyphosphate kinase 2 (PPK2 family)